MKKEQILLFEQETRDINIFNKIPEVLKIKKSKSLKIIIGFVSIFLIMILSSIFLFIIDKNVLIFIPFIFCFCISLHLYGIYDEVVYILDKKELEKIFLNRYGINSSRNSMKHVVTNKNSDSIVMYSESVIENFDIDNIEYSILFLTERYVYSENKKNIESIMKKIKNRIQKNKVFILNKKRMLMDFYKEVPYISNIIDVNNLELTEEEIEIEKSEQEKLIEENKKLKEEINNLKKDLNKRNSFESGGFRCI